MINILNDIKPSDLGIMNKKFKEFREIQLEAIEVACYGDKRFQALAVPTGCIAGDTIVHLHRAKKGEKAPIADWFRRQHSPQSHKLDNVVSMTRSMKGDGRIGLHRMVRFLYSGRKATWTLTLANGRTLRATPEHPILTTKGYVQLQHLKSTHGVVCDTLMPKSNGTKAPKLQYKQVQNLYHHPFAGGAKSDGVRMYRVPKHRLVVESSINGISVAEMTRICKLDKKEAQKLTYLDPEYEVHHKDRNTLNNSLDNLEILTALEHRLEHGDHHHFNQGEPEVSHVINVHPSGLIEDVYDVECEDPHRNFVANGIVVHNSGKTMVGWAIAKVMGWRVAYLTITNALLEQSEKDFNDLGVKTIRGKTNYRCEDRKELTCRDGQRVGCRFYARDGSSTCVYDGLRRKAANGQLIQTNYAYWINVWDRAAGLCVTNRDGSIENPFDCLILDEADRSHAVLSDYLSVQLHEGELRDCLGVDGLMSDDIEKWRMYAKEQHREAGMQLENMERILALRGPQASKKELEHAARLESIVDKLSKIKSTTPDDWICEAKEGGKFGRSWQFDVIWPGRYAESKLFLGIPRVVLMSATLRPKTMSLLGVGRDEYEFHEWPRVFSAARNPIWFYPVKKDGKQVKLNYKTTEEDLGLVVNQIDAILDVWNDVKVLIPTVSYKRQEFIVGRSRHKHLMIGNTDDPDSPNAQKICEEFKKSSAPRILVSPSFSTGWDFPSSDCRLIIIPKIPHPNRNTRIMKARIERDEGYPNYIAMQELVQSAGRGMRSEDDFCAVMILDGGWSRLVTTSRSLAPRWFVDGVRTTGSVPERMKLEYL